MPDRTRISAWEAGAAEVPVGPGLRLRCEHAHDWAFEESGRRGSNPHFSLGSWPEEPLCAGLRLRWGPTGTSAGPPYLYLGHAEARSRCSIHFPRPCQRTRSRTRNDPPALARRKCHGRRRSEQPHQGCTRLPDRQVLPFKGHSQRCAHRLVHEFLPRLLRKGPERRGEPGHPNDV